MKKIIALLLCCLCVVTLAGCNEIADETLNEDSTEMSTSVECYAISYNLNAGINSGDNPDKIEKIDEIVYLDDPTRYAYTFKGWYDNQNFTGEVVTSINGKDLTGDISLYAKWELNQDYIGELPLVEINTQDGVLPYDKENYINCSFELSNCENDDYNFSVSMKDEYGDKDSVGIRLRGNSTIGAVKKPYRIKFDKKKSLFGLDEAKSWVLLADYYDQSAIRNYTAFSLGEYFDNLDFTATPHHVVLMINGEWKGLYLLCEQMDEKEGRTDVECDIEPTIDTDFPFLIEMDRNAMKEGETGIDNFTIEGLYPIEIKYPEFEDRNIEDGQEDVVFEYIKDYMTAVYETLYLDSPVYFQGEEVEFEDLVDVESFIDYHLLNELMFNQDSTWGSIYMHKSKNGKLEFGPIWDFDWSCSDTYKVPYDVSYIDCAQKLCISKLSTLFSKYIKTESGFQNVQNRWNEISAEVSNILEDLRLYKNEIRSIAHKDGILWYGDTGPFQFDMQYDYVRLFLYDRINFMDYAFNLNHSAFCELL